VSRRTPNGWSRGTTWCSLRALGPVKRCAIVYRGGGYCAWCRKPLTKDNCQIDHVVPRREGGPPTPGNLVASCQRCNTVRPDVPGDLAQLAEPLDYWAGLQLALAWYGFMPERLRDQARRRDAFRGKRVAENRAAEAAGLGGDAFPFGELA
jgi:hypothetical protein